MTATTTTHGAPAGAPGSGPDPLRIGGRELGSRIGVYGTVVEPGRVAVGDPVVIE